MKRITLATSILLLVCFYANAQSEFDRGFIQEGTYVNSGLGFTFKYPQGWTVHGKETDDRIREVGKEKVAGQDASTKASLEAALKDTHNLLTVFRHPVGTPGVGFNPGILVLAEKVSHAPGIKNGKDYLLNVRELMQRSGSKAFLKDPTEHSFAGWQFFRDDFGVESPRGQVYQAYVAHVLKGYALVFIFMGEDQKSVDELMKSMETLKLAPIPVRRGVVTTIDGAPARPNPN